MSARSKMSKANALKDRAMGPFMNLASLLDRFFLLACLLFVYLVYGSIPSVMLGHLGIVEWQIGFAQSLATGGFFSYPEHMSYPHGAPIVFGASYAYLQAVLIKLFGLNGLDSYGLASILFLTVAFWGAVRLLQAYGIGHKLSYALATVYLASPFIISHVSYAALAYGMAMFPAYAFITQISFSIAIDTALPVYQRMVSALGFISTVVFAVFLDGYTFIMFFVLAVFFIFQACAGESANTRRLIARGLRAGALYGLAFATAYIAMKAYVPDLDSLRLQTADVFRAMGLDLYFVLHPASELFWLMGWLGSTVEFDAGTHYGDGSIAIGSYLGFSLATLLLGLFYSSLAPSRRCFLAILIVVVLFLSLGPSVKYDSRRIDIDDPSKPAVQYHMPTAAAVFSLGTDRLYELVPGIRNMRATYRWHALTIFFTWFVTAMLLARLSREGRHATMLLLLFPYMADRLPDPFLVSEKSEKYYDYASTMTRDVVHEMGKFITPGEIVYFWPSGNDFFVSYAAPFLAIRAYNVGGDKNMDISRRHWPSELNAVENGECVAQNVHALMESRKLDAVVVPKFDMLRDVSRPWPLASEVVKSHEQEFLASAFVKETFLIQESEYFYVIRERPGVASERDYLPLGKNIYFSQRGAVFLSKTCVMTNVRGFSQPESWGRWTVGNEAGFAVRADTRGAESLEIEIEWMGFSSRSHPSGEVGLYLFGNLIKRLEYRHGMPPKVNRVTFATNSDSQNVVLPFTVGIKDPKSPRSLGLSDDARELGIAVRRLCITMPGIACTD